MAEYGTVDVKRVTTVTVASIILGVICLIALTSPDERKYDRQFREDIKKGTQLKDACIYIKDHGWTYEWIPQYRELVISIGQDYLPIVRVRYNKQLFFDEFNRLKAQSGAMEYTLH
jgi:hypothetical protein